MAATSAAPSRASSGDDPYLAALERARAHLRRRDGDEPAAEGPGRRRLRRSRARGVQRDPRRHPARRHRPAAPIVPRRRRRRHRDRLVRLVLRGAGRVRHRRPGPRTRPPLRRRSPGRRPTPSRPRPAPLRRWLHRPGDQVPDARPDLATSTSRAGYEELAYGLLEGGVDVLVIETMFDLFGQGGDRRRASRAMVAPRPPGPHPGPGHHRADRSDAAGHRDRRRPHGPEALGDRRHRAQLRDRTGRDGRAAAPPGRARAACRSRASPTPVSRASSMARCTTT